MTELSYLYFDFAATAPLASGVAQWLTETGHNMYGNPGASHALGAKARKAVNETRDILAGYLKADPKWVCFNTGGTESIATLFAHHGKKRNQHWQIGISEHPSIQNGAGFWQKHQDIKVSKVQVFDAQGFHPQRYYEQLKGDETFIVLTAVHGELGWVAPIPELAKKFVPYLLKPGYMLMGFKDWVNLQGIFFFPDEVDSIGLSGHKIGSPKGIGALVSKKEYEPLIPGGGQEQGRRSGTLTHPPLRPGARSWIGMVKICMRATNDCATTTNNMLIM